MNRTFTIVLPGLPATTGARALVRRPPGIVIVIALSFTSLAITGLRAAPDKPAGLAWIPGGEFTMGTDEKEESLNYRPSARRGTDYDTGMSHLGFRCVPSPDQRDNKTTETSTNKTSNKTTNKP